MPLPHLLSAVRLLSEFAELERFLRSPRAAASLPSLPGSSAAALLAALAESQSSQQFLVIAPGPAEAERWLADLALLLPEDRVRHYPQREALGDDEHHVEIAGERAETLEALSRGAAPVVVTTARASLERTLMPAALAERFEIGPGARFRDVVAGLERLGYQKVPQVADVAQYAVRGGIVDVYGFGMVMPARAEFWGDALAELRAFDLGTQRGAGALARVTVLPVDPRRTLGSRAPAAGPEGPAPGAPSGAPLPRSSLLELVSPLALVVREQPAACDAAAERAWREAEHHAEVARRLGEEVPPREELFLSPDAWRRALAGFASLSLGSDAPAHRFPAGPPPAVGRDLAALAPPAGGRTLVLCDNEGQLERLDELLAEGPGGMPDGVQLAIGALAGGFTLPGLTVLTDHEIFHRARRLRRPRRYRQAPPAAAGEALRPGDYVVHLEHGVGIYRGIRAIQVQDATLEVAAIEYAGGDLLHLPLYRIDQLERWRSVDGDGAAGRVPPKLHALGGARWRRQREQAEGAVRRMAAELLELYARRQLVPGYAFPPDTRWQRELESSFLYEDTPDQRRAAAEVKADMERPRPMDRLVVGDVGYGKTEIAVRAAFKAVQAGKQVVVLAPTTILVEQHLRTFGERFADYPVRLAAMSRLHGAAELRRVLAEVAGGTVDVLIGTHRLLSPDVVFKDLGLVVVDEEHRFGVEHKERLKKLRLAVDVLTLTATPIPRTLQLSLTGLRDLTLIETPPRDRSPVLTYVEPWDDALLEEALARELDRGGQAYVVHNRIETLEAVAERVRRLVPRGRVATAHGKMRPRELDGHMRRFVDGEVDVLCSTMIVESGLDVPNANTMIVHDAHQFGLAQLYQLRGRVGRGHRRAYCYLVVPDAIDPAAEARLATLAHHTDLGSGYRIALKDLELRGAGNLLGAEQSGFALSVGVDLYLRLLEETVRALRGERRGVPGPPPDVLLERAAYLPDTYVADDAAKLDLYRRLAKSLSSGEIAALREELADRFGPLPPEAEALVALTQLRVMGARLGLETVVVRGDEARLVFRAGAAPRLARLTAALDDVQFAAEVRRAQPLALRLERLGGMDLLPGLVHALGRVAEDPSG